MISNDWTAAVLKIFADKNENGRAPAFNPTRALTYSAGTFFQHQSAALSVLFGMLQTSIFADNAAFVAGKIIREEYDYSLPNSFEPLVILSQEPDPYLRRFKIVGPPLMEMILIRLADNFTTYLLDVIGECIISRPGLLLRDN